MPSPPDALDITEIEEFATCELSAIVSDYTIWNPKPMDDVLDELRRALRLEVDDGSDLDPLGEFVSGDQEVIEASRSLSKLLNHVEVPDCEWPGDGDCLKCLH